MDERARLARDGVDLDDLAGLIAAIRVGVRLYVWRASDDRLRFETAETGVVLCTCSASTAACVVAWSDPHTGWNTVSETPQAREVVQRAALRMGGWPAVYDRTCAVVGLSLAAVRCQEQRHGS